MRRADSARTGDLRLDEAFETPEQREVLERRTLTHGSFASPFVPRR